MKVLLNNDEIETLNKQFSDNAIFAIFQKLFKTYERELKTLALAPEEVFINCILSLDNFRKSYSTAPDIEELFDNLFCDIRNAARQMNRPYEDDEIQTATLIILLATAICCLGIEDSRFLTLTHYILDFIKVKDSSFFDVGVKRILMKFNDDATDNFCIEINKIFNQDIYLSEQIALNASKNNKETKGRHGSYLFHTKISTEKDEEKTRMWADMFKRRLQQVHANSSKIDTTVKNPIFIQLLGFIEYWHKHKVIDKEPPCTTYTKFLTEDCNILMDVTKQGIDAFFRKYLNAPKIRNENFDRISETEDWIKTQLSQ